jgi:hypothetical protein
MKRLHGLLALQIFFILSISQLLAQSEPDKGFGTELPLGVKPIDVIRLIAPYIDKSLVTLIGMKKWPYKENTYMAIICVSRSKSDYSTDSAYSNGKQCCRAGYGGSNESENPKIVYLSMIEFIDRLNLIASYPVPLNIRTSWIHSNIMSPDHDSTSNLNPGIYDRFDFANFKVSDNQVAFGIRVGWRTMYSGGGGYFSALMLFIVQGDKIVNILSEPTDEDGMSAGEWNDDGTRGKNFWETHNVIIMLPHKTSGYFDLRIKQTNSKWSQDFKWSIGKNRYIPMEKNN